MKLNLENLCRKLISLFIINFSRSILVFFLLLTSTLQADTIPLQENWEILEMNQEDIRKVLVKDLHILRSWKKYKQGQALPKESYHVLRVKVSISNFKEPTLYIGKNIFSFQVFSDEKEIYTFSDKSQFEAGKFLGWLTHLVSLPVERKEEFVYFKVYSGERIGFPGAQYNEKDELYKIIIRDNLPNIGVVVISILLGSIFLFVSIFARRDPFYFAISSFYIFIGVWLLNVNPISQFVLPSTPSRLRIEYLSLYLAPIGALYILESILKSRLNLVSKFFRYLFLIYTVVSATLDLAEIFPLWKTLIPFDILLLFGFIHYIYQVARYSIRGNREARIIGVGIMLLVAFAIHDIFVVLRIIENIMLMHFGTLSFILSMTGIIVLRVNNLYIDVKNKSEELEINNKALDDLNQNLELKVMERTKEVTDKMNMIQKLMNQQNGDYFLTSLIQKPLITNRNKSKIATTEIYINQKKKFEFKGQESELGGDVCITGNLRFYSESERYIFFFNGDAMGKSMQGAGGAIVAGTVVNNIIARSARSNKVLNISQEEWLENTCREIEEIFCTFDGSMLLSAAMGIIQESTGLLWYVNFEHPRTILYRDRKAVFLDSETNSAYKFGSSIELDAYPIVKFQLEKGDILIAGSDGRDDLNISENKDQSKVINIDYNLILEITEKGKGTIPGILQTMEEYGEQTDDLSLIRITFS
jgi:hypothetical protein